jgi:signal transduction histidine kinase
MTAYAVIGLAGGLCLATGALVWLGYVATREWRRGTEGLVERRQAEAAALVAAALDRDMRGASASLLIPMNFSMLDEEPAYDLLQLTARAFARFPYPESLVLWKGTPDGGGVTYAFNRTERWPPWEPHSQSEEPFPIAITKNPDALVGIIAEIRRKYDSSRPFAAIDMTVGEVPYQLIVHYLIDPHIPSRLSAFAALTVNLNWVRSDYFAPVLQQTAKIGGNTEILSFSVRDDHNTSVTATGQARTDSNDAQRSFPLLFIDRALVTPARGTAFREWTVHVQSSRDNALMSAMQGAQRTFFLIAISALMTVAALMMTIRAVEARAALATMKSDFVSAVTHELKTPLAAIRLVGDTLAAGRYTSPKAVEEYARLLSHEASRLSQSIDQLLTYARYSDAQKPGGFQFASHDVSALIEQGLEGLRPALAAGGFNVDIDVPQDLPPVWADAPAVAQVVENVIDNSIKYVSSNTTLRITGRANGKFVRIVFADHGIGIPKEDLNHVFDRFYRASNAKASGSGLGLAIAKRIVDVHGGRIRVQSTLNVGTEVELLLPIGTP